MKKYFNHKAIIVALSLILIGVVCVVLDVTVFKTEAYVVCSVFSSVIASGIVLICTTLFIDFKKRYEVWDDWKLKTIYRTRAEKSADSDPKLRTHRVKQLDGIAFGLRAFRSREEREVLACLRNGMSMRLITMDPTSEFVKQREREEGEADGSISKSIEALCQWANKLNKQSNNGKIHIKFYSAMTIDFYWRMDDEMYVGPYLINKQSQQTITYKFINGGEGFSFYSNYFEEIWNNSQICYVPQKSA